MVVATIVTVGCSGKKEQAPPQTPADQTQGDTTQTAPETLQQVRTPVTDAAVADTVRGIVEVTGNEPMQTAQLKSLGGAYYSVIGPVEKELRAAAGLEVTVRGRMRPAMDDPSSPTPRSGIDAVSFVVRAADGVAAHDGLLVKRGDGFGLQTADGIVHPLPALPATLREMLGARIYLVGPLDRAPVGYGVLREAAQK